MAKDFFHQAVKTALIKDGWNITDDPLRLSGKGESRLEADLGGEKFIGAEKGLKRIAVEVKSFTRPSLVNEFHAALGQFLVYFDSIERRGLDWVLFLAVPAEIYKRLTKHEHILYSINKRSIKFLLFNQQTQSIESWIE